MDTIRTGVMRRKIPLVRGRRSGFKRILTANPALAHFSWLNLRTYKTGISGLDLQEPLSEEMRKATKLYATGTNSGAGQRNTIHMCPASEGWQKSRLVPLE